MVWGDGSAGPATGGGASSGAAQAGSSAQGASPTGWVNVQNYLDANRSQADAMGNNLAGQLDKEATTAAGAADKYRADANTYATASKETLNPAYVTWFKELERIQGSKAGGNPGVLDAYMATQPQKMLPNPNVSAPSMPSLPGKALEKIKAAGTPEGRAEMFAEKAGPSYNAGQSNLDSYLAGAGGGGQALQGLGQKYGNVLDIVRYPFPGYPSVGNRPGGPSDGPEPGTVPQPVVKPPGESVFGPGQSGLPGQRPGEVRPGTTPGTTKRKRFA
jgi:hypothetical protein